MKGGLPLGLMLCWWALLPSQFIHSFRKDLLNVYYVPGTPLGTKDKADTNPEQARTNNYVKCTGCQWVEVPGKRASLGTRQGWPSWPICAVCTYPETAYDVPPSWAPRWLRWLILHVSWAGLGTQLVGQTGLDVTVKEFFRFFR